VGIERETAVTPVEKDAAVANLRKLGPVAKLPAVEVLKALSAADRRLLRRRLSEPVECVYYPGFAEPGAQGALRAGVQSECARNPGQDSNDDSGMDLLSTARDGVLASGDERHKFLWLNYCRYRVLRVIEEHAGRRLSAPAAAELVRWEHASVQAREEIVRANIPLVLAMAKRARINRVDFSDLVSEGNLALMRSVDKFDCTRGYKFSTYACRAILKSFSRVASRAARYRGHFPTEFDPSLERSDQLQQRRASRETDCVDELKSILGKNLAELSAVEARVIRARFAIDVLPDGNGALQGKTLEQVGAMIGVTKERVRQIQNKALDKLRQVLDGGVLGL
jgi:RNA polymerase primary sigma factor